MSFVRRAPLALSITLGFSVAWSAYADPSRPDSDPCRGRHDGDVCEADDFEGTCRRRRCTRETENGLHTFHCLVCESRRHGRHRRHRDATVETDVSAPLLSATDAATEPLPDGSTGDVARLSDALPFHELTHGEFPPTPPPRNRLRCSLFRTPTECTIPTNTLLSLTTIFQMALRRARRRPMRFLPSSPTTRTTTAG